MLNIGGASGHLKNTKLNKLHSSYKIIFHQNGAISYRRPAGTHNTSVEQVCPLNIGGAACQTNELINLIKTNPFTYYLVFFGNYIYCIPFNLSKFVYFEPSNQLNIGGACIIYSLKLCSLLFRSCGMIIAVYLQEFGFQMTYPLIMLGFFDKKMLNIGGDRRI